MATLTPEEKIDTLIALMAGETEISGDAFNIAAKELGLKNRSQVTQRLKSIVEATGNYKVNSTGGCKSVTTIIRVDGENEADTPLTPKSPSTGKTSKAANGETKKRGKRGSNEVDGGEENVKAVKKAKKSKTAEVEKVEVVEVDGSAREAVDGAIKNDAKNDRDEIKNEEEKVETETVKADEEDAVV